MISTMLMGIQSNADLARRKVPTVDPAAKLLNPLIGATQNAAELASQLLDYAGRGTDPLEPTNLSEAVESSWHLLSTARPKTVELRLDLTPHLPAVDAALGQIQQVLVNLVANAAQSIPADGAGSITISTDVTTLTETNVRDLVIHAPPGEYVHVSVADDGAGMSDRDILAAFDPFYTTKPGGRGLGMRVVLGNIRRHSGTLRIRSARDTGTTAEVFLPIGAHPALETIKSDVVSLREPNRGTVPVIDDDDLVRDLCKAYVELEGYTAVTASDGQDGLSIFNELAGRGTPVAAVVLDLVMPRMDGTRPYALSTHTCPSFDVPASMNMTD